MIKQVVAAIPTELYSAIAAGIGLLLALVGFRNSGIIVPSVYDHGGHGKPARPEHAAGDLRACC